MTSPLALLTRVPPGVWTAAAWAASTVFPVVRYVWRPPEEGFAYSYPRDGLDDPVAVLLLCTALLAGLAGSAVLDRRPATAFGLLLAGAVLTAAAWRQTEIAPPQLLAVLMALGFLAAARPRRVSLAAGCATLVVLACFAVGRLAVADDGSGTPSEPYVALVAVIAWLVGDSARRARCQAAALRERAAAAAVTAERLRIARELHDMVAHSIGVIALQAGAAKRVIGTQPALAGEALGVVEGAARETLAGLRRMLGALREADGADRADGSAGPAAPDVGLRDLERLVAATTSAGLRVDLTWRGERAPLPPEIDASAYRIVQEALTNVVRHSGASSCRVVVEQGADELRLEVVDDGHGGHGVRRAPGGGTGWGLVGLRERAALLHGYFAAGPRPEGGFKVAVRLPVPSVVAPLTAVPR